MNPSDSGRQVFDEGEVARILKRTAELQGRLRGRPATGLTLDELQELALESGLDPMLVSAAVSELRAETSTGSGTWWGGPVEHNLEHTFRGTVGGEAWERMIEVIRRALGQEGEIEERGGTREWVRKVMDGNGGRVSIREAGGETTIQIFWRVAMPPILLYMAEAVVTILALPVLFETLGVGLFPGLTIWIAAALSLFFVVRWMVSRNTSRERQRATKLLSDLVAIAAEEESHGDPESIRAEDPLGTASASRIELEEDDGPASSPDGLRPRTGNREV